MQARLRDKEIRKAKEAGADPPPFRYVDIDGIAEVVDVLRGCGLTEASDPMICQATVWLLKMQNKQGDWPVYFNHGDGNMKNDKSSSYYDKVHPCWVTVQSLVAKGTFHNETYERWVKNVVRESNFNKLGYEATWNRSSRSKKKDKEKTRRRQRWEIDVCRSAEKLKEYLCLWENVCVRAHPLTNMYM